jgi:hypothetical protein
VVVAVAVVDGFQIFSQAEMVAVVLVAMLDEDSHHHQVFEMIILEMVEQVRRIFEISFIYLIIKIVMLIDNKMLLEVVVLQTF